MIPIKAKIFNGLKWTVFASAVLAIGNIFQLSILTRLLPKSDFGLLAITNVFIGFAAIFIDIGVGGAIIHKRDVASGQLSTLFWLNILSGVLFFLIITACSPLLAAYYKTPALSRVASLASAGLLLSTLGFQYKILLQKDLRFNLIAQIEISAFILGFILSIALASRGFGVYALIFANLARTLLSVICYIYKGKDLHRLTLHCNISEVVFFLRFGLFQLGERIVNYSQERFDVFYVAALCAPDQLGVYDVVKRTLNRPVLLINPIFNKITLPVMAEVQDQNPLLTLIFQKSMRYLCCINFPVFVFAFVAADPLVTFLFGPEWVSAVYIFRLFCVYFLLYSAGNPVGALLTAKGKASWGFYWNLAILPISLIYIYVGSSRGVTGVAESLIAFEVSLFFFNYYFQIKPLITASTKEYFINIGIPFLLSAIAGAGGWGLGAIIAAPLLKMTVIALSGCSFYSILTYFFNYDFFLDLKNLMSGKIKPAL